MYMSCARNFFHYYFLHRYIITWGLIFVVLDVRFTFISTCSSDGSLNVIYSLNSSNFVLS